MLNRLKRDWDGFVGRRQYGPVEKQRALESYTWARIRKLLDSALIFELSNVNEYIVSLGRSQWTPRDLPVVRPPHDVVWAEWFHRDVPSEEPGAVRVPGDRGIALQGDQIKKVGVLVHTETVTKDGVMFPNVITFIEMKDGRWGFGGIYAYACGEDGEWLAFKTPWTMPGSDDAERQAQDEVIAGKVLGPLLLGFSFLHCKNVVVKDNEPSEPLQRARKRRGRPPMVTYKTLEIEPMKRVLKTEGRVDEVGLKQALHICRGHFKDYRERGLFGRESHRGIYWWETHVRGNPSEGVVVKDYKVNAPT